MYRTSDGEELFIVDGHTHFWDAAPANQRNVHGKQFIDCFYTYHSALSPEAGGVAQGEVREVRRGDDVQRSLCGRAGGHGDHPADLPQGVLYRGLNTTEQNAVITQAHPDRFILNGAFDPREARPRWRTSRR